MTPRIPFREGSQRRMNEPTGSLEIDCRTVNARLEAGEPLVLLDCREPDEHEFVRLAASRLLPMSELMLRVGELDEVRDAEIVVYCQHCVSMRPDLIWLLASSFPIDAA